MASSPGRARAPAAKGSTTIYDSYPLSLRTLFMAADGEPPPPHGHSRSHVLEDSTQPVVQKNELLSTLHDTSSSMDSSVLDLHDGMQSTAEPSCRPIGKVLNEVFEPRERSKVLSALRHRGKAATKRTAGAPHNTRRRPMGPPPTFTAEDVLRAGTLTKQGSWRRNWKTRFFILRSDCPSLCYFTSEDKLELLGEIAITEDTIVLDRSGGGTAPFRFQVRSDARTLLLEAESRDLQKRWMDSCQELADAIRASKFSVNTSVSSLSGALEKRRSSVVKAGGGTRVTDVGETSASSQHVDETEHSSVLDDTDMGLRRPRRLTVGDSLATQDSGRLYDLSVSVLMGRRSKLARSVEQLSDIDKEKDRMGCFVAVSGYIHNTKQFVDLGVTDVVKLTTLVAACGAASSATGEPMPMPFSIVMTAELERYDQLRLTLCKSQLTQSPGTSQGTFGVGCCLLDDHLLGSTPCAVLITECGTALRDPLAANAPVPPQRKLKTGESSELHLTGSGSNSTFAAEAESVQLVVHAFRSVPPQSVLPTTGVDMANAKYLIPSTLAPGRETASKLVTDTRMEFPGKSRGSDVRTFMENDTFVSDVEVGMLNEASYGSLRFVAVDEILRVPRSTFALPVAYLDFLEEQALERSRWLQKQLLMNAAQPRNNERLDVELNFLRKKQEEYLKQRQFLIQQEKRLLDEQEDGKFFLAAKRAGLISVANERDPVSASSSSAASSAPSLTVASSASTRSGDAEAVAPFKRSTYKNLNLWQFLPTNMQDQFLCTYKPPVRTDLSHGGRRTPTLPRRFVWHTMTMGCPAAHTKGFANGGYPASVPIMVANSNGALDEEVLDSRYGGGSQRPTSPVSAHKGGNSNASGAQGDDTLTGFKLRLELQDRLTVIGSQILSATAACILASLDLALNGSALHQAQLDRAPTFGFLMNFESLLSTQGKEYGMLEDFAAGARWLRNIFIQFRRHTTTGSFFSFRKYTPPGSNAVDQNCFLLTIGIDSSHMSVLPQSLVSGDGTVRVRCVLFSQGVNEKQSLVHAYKSSAVKLQERVNRDNLQELKRIYALYRQLRMDEMENRVWESRQARSNSGASLGAAEDADGAATAMDRHDLQALDDLLVQIEHHICSSTSQYKKNVALLMDSSDFCRALGGARVTCCKSGKDRTAMSVTLEQTRLLRTELQAAQDAALCANMRLYGVRRRNVFMNTKADKFAFNEVQRKMLPECYKPPVGTYKSGKT
uniref:PH domain-containing protein n=1 Tax=Peronospora matthiolae TaxID=2874970 RepID=A0AAV1U6U8_9STRA